VGPVFLILVTVSVLAGAWSGRMQELTEASITGAAQAVELAIGLVGMMTLWLGLTEALRRAGLVEALARGLRPLFRRLFPSVPDGHPALGAMTLNMGANLLGLSNAATPFGIEAMRQLDRLNGRPGTITDAQALFLAINTAGVSLLPLGAMAVRAQMGSKDPAGIIATTLLATVLSTGVAVAAALVLARLPQFRKSAPPPPATGDREQAAPPPLPPAPPPPSPWRAWSAVALGVAAITGAALALARLASSDGGAAAWRYGVSWLPLPLLILGAVLYAWTRGVPVYAAVVEGGKEGFQVAVRIIPFMVAILTVAAMFRASGALAGLEWLLAPLTEPLGFPAAAIPMALMRPLSGSGALAIMSDTMKVSGPDSFVGYLVSTIQGSSETTFYVLAVYGGAVGLARTRHAIPACLAGDLAGTLGSLLAVRLLLG
jgi:spore maturation protein SpmA/spore maturation protein SpmB